MSLSGNLFDPPAAVRIEQPAAKVEQPAAKVEQPAAKVEQPEVKATEDRIFWGKLFKQAGRVLRCHDQVV
ncbi:uncharacterized protein RHO25_007132 [Cercospora beticola]|uniref:Uncharacterized protein n=1 Tax=Cercospora beticola TaxID=122368 RepID=A0ABZ0NSP4_CERBT|nr:hypothetical protein RHO25_007132 [Cercospora beticola]CAK1362610.1 unnamed protein product [Cercospora beticola]